MNRAYKSFMPTEPQRNNIIIPTLNPSPAAIRYIMAMADLWEVSPSEALTMIIDRIAKPTHKQHTHLN